MVDAALISQQGVGLADGVVGIGYVISYVTAFVFFMTGLIKIKKHRENPQQIHLSMALTDFFVSLCMFLLPYFAQHSNAFIFGQEDTRAEEETNLPHFNIPSKPPNPDFEAPTEAPE